MKKITIFAMVALVCISCVSKKNVASVENLFPKAFNSHHQDRIHKYKKQRFDRLVKQYELEKDTTLTKQEQIQQLLNNF